MIKEYSLIKLSIIIPHYNSSEMLNKLIQTIPFNDSTEVVIVDDNSKKEEKDKLFDLIKKNNSKNITLLSNSTKNKGAGACRNIGLKHARGKWILFADSDDCFLADCYEIISNYFDLDCDVVFFIPTSIDMSTGNLADRHCRYAKIMQDYIDKKDDYSELKLRFNIVVPWSKLIRADFVKKNNIKFEEIIVSNDVLFSAKLGYFMENFLVIDETIYCVTKSKGSLTNIANEKIFDVRFNTFIEYYQFLKHNLSTEEFKILNLDGFYYISMSLQYGLGIGKVISVFKILIKNNIKICRKNFLNPLYLFKKIILYFKRLQKEKKYLIK